MVKKSTVEQGNPLSLLNNNDESVGAQKENFKECNNF